MKKYWVVLLIIIFTFCLIFLACIHQTVHQDATFFEHHSYIDVWRESIHSVNDIGFTVHSLDKDAGFIGAESGPQIGQDHPPRLSILISQKRGRIYVGCKVLHIEEFVDIFGHGRRTIANFMMALHTRLNH